MVIPAHSNGAASTSSRLSGIETTASSRSHHVLLISAVIADAGYLHIATAAKISAPALDAYAVVTAVPAHANALALAPFSHSGAKCVHDACDFMPWNAGILDSGPRAFDPSASLWHTPHARTLMRTWPAPGSGISRSTTSKPAPAG